MVTKMAHVAPCKETQVKDLTQIITDNPVIGLVNINGIPGPQMQKMRANLRNRAILKIAKNKLLLIALEEMENKKENLIELVQSLDGQMGLLATDMNPFKLFQVLEKSKTKAPVKGGETSPDDIEIKAGETSFKPGPIVGELQRVSIPAAIVQGKVVIRNDKTVVKAGETISRELAQILTRLEIYPLEVGLDLTAVFENGMIFKKQDLDIDTQQYIDNLSLGSQNAFNLAFNSNYFNSQTILPLIQHAHNRAIRLIFNANIITPTSVEFMISKGSAHMLSLASHLKPDALDDELKAKLGAGAAAKSESAENATTKEPSEEQKLKDDKAKKEKKEEEKEVSEEEAAAGLGALFG